ncbi:MAG: transcriptional regulator PpsR [Pseudomonadota bacterium]
MLVRLNQTASAKLLESLADFSLLLNVQGRVLEIAVARDDLGAEVNSSWVGQDLTALVTVDSADRITDLIESAVASPGKAVRRDVSHTLPGGGELLVAYQAICVGDDSDILVLGQDMRPMANLRQQLMNAQHALEQEYWRLRQIETRYRRLFEMVGDAIIVVEGESSRVTEANPEANRLLSPEGGSIVGKPFPIGFDGPGGQAVQALLADARGVGKGSIQSVHSADTEQVFSVAASFLRQGDESRYLIRVSLQTASGQSQSPDRDNKHYMQETLRLAPDAVLITDEDGRLLAANKLFLDHAQLVSEEQALGQSVDRWLGKSGVDLNVLLNNLRRGNDIKLFSTSLEGEMGSSTSVEISACNVANPGHKTFAFFIRDVGRRVEHKDPASAQLPQSIEQISKQVGRVPLKELVRESTDVIEALCIEAALELTHDNRASAAELLGLSRQSLYAKLRRYGIGSTESAEA